MPWSIEPAQRLLTNHAETWQTINRTQYGAHPLLDIRFTRPLPKYFGSNHVYLALQRLQDEPMGMALVEDRGKGIWESFLPAQAPISPFLLARENYPWSLHDLLCALPGAP